MDELKTNLSLRILHARQRLNAIQRGQRRWYERQIELRERIRVLREVLRTVES